jgi:hypothetical protein
MGGTIHWTFGVIAGSLAQIRQLLIFGFWCTFVIFERGFDLAVDEDLARDVGRDHQPVGVDRRVDLLHDVQLYFFNSGVG